MKHATPLNPKPLSAKAALSALILTSALLSPITAMASDVVEPKLASESAQSEYIVADNRIIQTIAASEQHSDLTYALGKAGLATTLAQSGSYTVFAPLDSAFQAVDPEIMATLMTQTDTADLSKVLKTHVIPGTLDSFELAEMIEASLTGQYEVTNGVVHIVDTVLMPG